MTDWAGLPLDLIHLMSSNLPDVSDFIRFRAVCKSWRSSAPLSDPPLQLPWLLECVFQYAPETQLRQALRFYSLATGQTGTIPVKESHRGKSYHGPCSGYLLLLLEYWGLYWMWNPLTNADISLPSYQVVSHWPVWTGSGPMHSRNIVLMDRSPQIANEIGCWAVYHPGDTEWNVMKGFFYNSCYWDGMFFTITYGEEDTQVFNARSKKILYTIPSPKDIDYPWQKSYLVEISGVILRVCMYLEWDENVEESVFEFYELHFEGRDRKPLWVEVNDIGNHILFLDLKNGFSMKPVAGFKGNCIYFLSRHGNTPCMYDIATDTFQRVPCPFEACTWFLPSLC